MAAASLLFLAPCFGGGKTLSIYISPNGVDTNVGKSSSPVKTVEAAQRLAAGSFGKRSIDFIFMDGIHYLPKSIEITPAQSGTKRKPVTYKAENSGKAILSGGELIEVEWKPYKDGIYMAKVERSERDTIDQLYVGGVRRIMARYPNVLEGKNVFDCWDLGHLNIKSDFIDIFDKRVTSRWANPEGAYIHAMQEFRWGDMHWIVTGVDESGELIYEGGWQNNRPSKMHTVYRIIENVFEELDAPNEWFYDRATQTLYYYPESQEELALSSIEVVSLPNLINFAGDRENNISYVNIEGLVFSHTTRTFMDNKEPLLRSDWTTCREGAVTYHGAVNCEMNDCEFDQVGGNTVVVSNYNSNLLFYGCYVHDSGANGFVFVGDPDMVRSPLFQYAPQDYEGLDLTPGPKGDNYPMNCVVDNCLITRTGRMEKQTAPVQISMSYGITVSNCSIYDVPRAGININEGTFGGHIIDNCDVFNTVLETGDHGSFNSWGRDRFWTRTIKDVSDQVEKNPELPWLDVLEKNIIRNSRFRCDHGWDIDLDDGSSHYEIYNNVLLSGGLKCRDGYNRTATNNIIINNSFHPHVWYVNCEDTFKHNIVFGPYKQASMNRGMPNNAKWGKEVDYNLFVSSSEKAQKMYAKNSCDVNSLTTDDALFVNAAIGDFRLQENSPAFEIGFKSFETMNYGVQIPKLRAIAKTPEIPVLTEFKF